MSSQILVKPQGIVNEPNKVGQYAPGAAVRMTNVAIRSFGLMESVRKWRQFSTFFSSRPVLPGGGAYAVSDGRTSVFLKRDVFGGLDLFAYDAKTGTSELISVGSPYKDYVSDTGRTGLILFRNRLIVAGSHRSFVYDIYYDSGSIVLQPRDCGLLQISITNRATGAAVTHQPGDVSLLDNRTHISATAVLRMIHRDGYEILSVPAFPSDWANLRSGNEDEYSQKWSILSNNTPFAAAPQWRYELQVYRTRSQSVGYDTGTNKYHPVSTGSGFYLSQSADRTSSFQSVNDPTMPNSMGEALYTSNSASGAAAIFTPPPPAKCAAAYRGFVFYGNRFDPATVKILCPFYWGNLLDYASSTASLSFIYSLGIGERNFDSVTATNGSPTFTALGTGYTTTPFKVGQKVFAYDHTSGLGIASGTVVSFSSASGGSLTISSNATATATADIVIDDVIELNGTVYNVAYGATYFAQAVQGSGEFDVYTVGLEPQQPSVPAGFYPAYGATGGVTIRMRTNDPITLRATNGQFYSPVLPEFTATAKSYPGKQLENSFCWSENNQPEYVPPANYAYVGTGEIYQMVSTRDCLWIFCSDGLYRLSGTGGSVGDGYDWTVDPVDPGLFLSYVNAACAHREYVYAFTNRGFVSISSEGVIRELSDGRVNSAQSANLSNDVTLRNRPWAEASVLTNTFVSDNIWVCADARTDDILIRSNINNRGMIWAYNTKTDTFTCRSPGGLADVPLVCTYNSTLQEVLGIDAATGFVYGSSGVGFENWDVELQPIYGTANAKSAYTKKHWQDVNFSFKTPQNIAGMSMRMIFGSGSSVALEERILPVVSRFDNSNTNFPDSARVGFTVPRNAPATGNVLKISFFIYGSFFEEPDASNTLVLEGVEVNYIDFSDERILR